MLCRCLRAVGARTVCRMLPTLACGKFAHQEVSQNVGWIVYQAARNLRAEAFADANPSEWRPCYRAVLVDAAGTFLIPSESVSAVYLRYARPYGCKLSDAEVLARFRRAYNLPWAEGPLRYVGDARPFWREIVKLSTGCEAPEVSEDIYQYYSRAEAWHVMPGAVAALQRLKSAGVLLAVVSNFDTRLRPLLRDLGVEGLFDAVMISAEVCAEKPNPVIFDAAVRSLSATAMSRGTIPIVGFADAPIRNPTPAVPQRPQPLHRGPYPDLSIYTGFGPLAPDITHPQRIGGISAFIPDFGPLAPEQVVHVGDDRRNDCWGARDAGITAWLWGYDVRSWTEVADRVLLGRQVDDYYDDLEDVVQS